MEMYQNVKKHIATSPAVNVNIHRTSDMQSILRMLVNMYGAYYEIGHDIKEPRCKKEDK